MITISHILVKPIGPFFIKFNLLYLGALYFVSVIFFGHVRCFYVRNHWVPIDIKFYWLLFLLFILISLVFAIFKTWRLTSAVDQRLQMRIFHLSFLLITPVVVWFLMPLFLQIGYLVLAPFGGCEVLINPNW